MPLADLAQDIRLAGCSVTVAGGNLTFSCGLRFSTAAFRREAAVAFWRQHSVQVRAAHQFHHSQHFGVAASLSLHTSPSEPPVAYCTDDPRAERA